MIKVRVRYKDPTYFPNFLCLYVVPGVADWSLKVITVKSAQRGKKAHLKVLIKAGARLRLEEIIIVLLLSAEVPAEIQEQFGFAVVSIFNKNLISADAPSAIITGDLGQRTSSPFISVPREPVLTAGSLLCSPAAGTLLLAVCNVGAYIRSYRPGRPNGLFPIARDVACDRSE